MLHILTEKKGKISIIISLQRQQTRLYQLNTALISPHSWWGVRFLTFPLFFIFSAGSFFSNKSGLALKTWWETEEKKKLSLTVSVLHIYCTLPTSERPYRAYTIYTTLTYTKDVGSYSTLHVKESKMNKQKKPSSRYGKPLVLRADIKHLLKIVADTWENIALIGTKGKATIKRSTGQLWRDEMWNEISRGKFSCTPWFPPHLQK